MWFVHRCSYYKSPRVFGVAWGYKLLVSLDTTKIQTHLRLRFKQWVLCTVHGTYKYLFPLKQLQNWVSWHYSHIWKWFCYNVFSFQFSIISDIQTHPIFGNLFYYLTYFCYYSWVPLHFLVLFMGSTVLFQLTFSFIYSIFNKKFSILAK